MLKLLILAAAFTCGWAGPLDVYCNGKEDGNYHHPSTCYKFLACTAGLASEIDCNVNSGTNLVFLPDRHNLGDCVENPVGAPVCTLDANGVPQTTPYSCRSTPNGCKCYPGTYGDRCECTGSNPCSGRPCGNSKKGVCTYDSDCGGGYTCECNNGWEGPDCQTKSAKCLKFWCEMIHHSFTGYTFNILSTSNYLACNHGYGYCMSCPYASPPLVYNVRNGVCDRYNATWMDSLRWYRNGGLQIPNRVIRRLKRIFARKNT